MNELSKFCNAVLKAIESGNNPAWFDPTRGLCHNSRNYDDVNFTRIAMELEEIFSDFPDCVSPFNIDIFDYFSEQRKNIVYKNEKRLAFLHAYANI